MNTTTLTRDEQIQADALMEKLKADKAAMAFIAQEAAKAVAELAGVSIEEATENPEYRDMLFQLGAAFAASMLADEMK